MVEQLEIKGNSLESTVARLNEVLDLRDKLYPRRDEENPGKIHQQLDLLIDQFLLGWQPSQELV